MESNFQPRNDKLTPPPPGRAVKMFPYYEKKNASFDCEGGIF